MGVTGRDLTRGIGYSTLPPRAVAKSVVNTIYCWKQLQLLGSGQLDEFPEHRCQFYPGPAGSPEVVVQLLGHGHHGAVVQVPGAPAGGRCEAGRETDGVSETGQMTII